MRLITSLVGIASLSFVTSVLAQEEETATPASEEKPIHDHPGNSRAHTHAYGQSGYQPGKGTSCSEKRRARDDACSCKDRAICPGKENERGRHVEG